MAARITDISTGAAPAGEWMPSGEERTYLRTAHFVADDTPLETDPEGISQPVTHAVCGRRVHPFLGGNYGSVHCLPKCRWCAQWTAREEAIRLG